MRSKVWPFFLVVLAAACGLSAGDSRADTRKRSPYVQVEEDPALPRVLILGDSISIGYTLPVRARLAGKANVQRAPTNCGPTTRGLEHLDAWIGQKPWDVIHFNFGLHDLKYMDEKGQLVKNVADGHQQVPVAQYEENLEAIVGRLKDTGAVLIFATTTPVPQGAAGRTPSDAGLYNAAALRVMKRHKVRVNDLYDYCLDEKKGVAQLPANVHFTPEGSSKLAEEVVRHIETALPR